MQPPQSPFIATEDETRQTRGYHPYELHSKRNPLTDYRSCLDTSLKCKNCGSLQFKFLDFLPSSVTWEF